MENTDKNILTDSKERLKLYLWMIFAMTVWGLSWSNGKIVAGYAPAKVLMFWRFIFAAIAMMPIIFYRKISIFPKKKAIVPLLVCAFMLACYNFCFFTGTKVGLAGAGGVLVTTMNPIFTYFVMMILYRKKCGLIEITGLVLGGIGGSFLLKVWELDWHMLVNSGNMYFLLCSLTWVVITIVSPKAQSYIHSFVYSFWVFLIAAIMVLPFTMDGNLLMIFELDKIFWLNMSLVSLGALSFATSIYFMATNNLGPDKAASFIFVVPVSAMLCSMMIFGEVLKWNTLTGGVLAIIAVYMINYSKKDKKEEDLPRKARKKSRKKKVF